MEHTISGVAPVKAHGYDKVAIANALVGKLDSLDDLWKQFLGQSESEKKRHVFMHGAGYEAKGPTDRDYKENFHIKLGYQLPANHTELDARFITTAKRIIGYSVPAVRLVFESIKQQTGFDLGPMALACKDQWVLRALWYPPRPMDLSVSAVVADAHLDKSVTLHLRESDSGFELFWNNRWIGVSHEKGKGIFYAGLLGQLHTHCDMTAVLHRGVFDEMTMHTGRRAFVLFIDFGSLKYDKQKWGTTHEAFPDCLNYSMEFDEFQKYFTEVAFATD